MEDPCYTTLNKASLNVGLFVTGAVSGAFVGRAGEKHDLASHCVEAHHDVRLL